jgi:hypothetical protein
MATRNHAEAMPIEELQQMMQWSEAICPSRHVRATARAAQLQAQGLAMDTMGTKTGDAEDVDTKDVVEHAMMRAFSSMAFTLWAR